MIIIISGPQGSGKTTLAKVIAESGFNRQITGAAIDIIDGIPDKKPSKLPSRIIYTTNQCSTPAWLLEEDTLWIPVAGELAKAFRLLSLSKDGWVMARPGMLAVTE